MWRDLRFALRALAHQPTFVIVVVLTLALGIGGSTTIFSVVNAVLLRDLPYPESRQLYLVRSVTAEGSLSGLITPKEMRAFSEVDAHPTVAAAAVAWSQDVQVVGADGRPHPTMRYGVTDRFFDVFGSRMALGQAFTKGQAPGPIVMAHALWRDHFNADPDIVGRTIQAEGGPRQVIGVTPAGFDFPGNPGYWYLMRLGTNYDRIRGYLGYVRLRPGRTGEQFQSEVTALADALGPDAVTARPSVLVAQPFLDHVVGDLRTTVTVLFGATGILLLIACINVTNLLLSRATARSREMALREAVGAARWHIVRLLLVESACLALLGGVLGLASAAAGVRLLLQIAPAGLPRLDAVPMDGVVVAFAAAITVLCALLVGLAPAWRLARNPLRSLINEGGRGVPDGPAGSRVFSALVVTEMALAVLLVIGGGLLVRSYLNLTSTDPGFQSDRVLTFFMNVPGRVSASMIPDSAGGKPRFSASYEPMAIFLRDLQARIRALPGVEAVALTSSLPLHRNQYDLVTTIHLPDLPGGTSADSAFSARSRSVSPDFFTALNIRLLAGRPLQPSDRISGPGVAVVNQTFARRFFSDRNPLGQRIRYPENPWVPGEVGFQLAHLTVNDLEIVGVVDDVKYLSLGEPVEASIYLSNEQWIHRRQTFVVRAASGRPETLVPAIRREIEAVDRLLGAEFAVYTSIVETSTARARLATVLLVVFALAALALAAVGVYGLMAYSVTQRTGEIAVRSAIGASRRQVLGLVLGRGARLALGGIVLGVIGAVALRQVVASQLYGVTALDVRVFGMAAVVLLVVAAAACAIPAQRAARIRPADLLRLG